MKRLHNILNALAIGLVVYSCVEPFEALVAPYYTQPRACGDCTVLGSNVKPDFWID